MSEEVAEVPIAAEAKTKKDRKRELRYVKTTSDSKMSTDEIVNLVSTTLLSEKVYVMIDGRSGVTLSDRTDHLYNTLRNIKIGQPFDEELKRYCLIFYLCGSCLVHMFLKQPATVSGAKKTRKDGVVKSDKRKNLVSDLVLRFAQRYKDNEFVVKLIYRFTTKAWICSLNALYGLKDLSDPGWPQFSFPKLIEFVSEEMLGNITIKRFNTSGAPLELISAYRPHIVLCKRKTNAGNGMNKKLYLFLNGGEANVEYGLDAEDAQDQIQEILKKKEASLKGEKMFVAYYGFESVTHDDDMITKLARAWEGKLPITFNLFFDYALTSSEEATTEPKKARRKTRKKADAEPKVKKADAKPKVRKPRKKKAAVEPVESVEPVE